MRRTALLAALAVTLLSSAAQATTTPSNVPNTLRDAAATGASRALLVRVDEVLNALTYTYYTNLDVWRPGDGVYKVVCSQYLAHLLEEAAPAAFDAVSAYSGRRRPLSVDYWEFFRTIDYGETADGWTRVRRVKDLRPGDVVAWKYTQPTASGAIGHVLVVVSVPERDYRFDDMTVYRVRVSDSTSSPHSNDNRCGVCTGVGAGEMLFRADPSTGKPIRFSWSLGGWVWRADASFAMARPAD